MTCHHTHNPFILDGKPYWANRVVGDNDRCRCRHRQNAFEHCHQRADGEDMICMPCRVTCQDERGVALGFIIEVPQEPILQVMRDTKYCTICTRNAMFGDRDHRREQDAG